MSLLREKLKAFEIELDAELAARPTLAFDATAGLGLAANIYETIAAQERSPFAGFVDDGMVILGPHFISGQPGSEPDIEPLFADLQFAAHYYMLREYLYYSYNAPGAISWNIGSDAVDIRFLDPTIPRQFFTVHNDTLLGSLDLFSSFDHGDEIRRLLKGEPEGAATPNAEAAFSLIAEEVRLKLSAYFSLLPDDSKINLGGYTYSQFLAFYRELLAKALYHRYFAEINDAVGAIFISESELITAAAEEPGLSPDVTRAILADIVYDARAVRDKADASYFSLFRESGEVGRIVMRPHHFAVAEGLVNLLRVVAQRRPQVFLDRVSNDLGAAFVRRAKSAWEAQGFKCLSEVSLRDIDSSLPDIDLLVISEEPTLGYVILVCELKSPLPPRWAKDQLKALNRDSVSKAFRQAEAIRSFLGTKDGVSFLRNLLPENGLPPFDGFVVAVQSLIITSDNAGMFFGSEKTSIINFRTLERLLDRSDGDMAFIQMVISTYNQNADAALKTTVRTFEMAGRKISYEGVTVSALLDFPRVKWRSSPERQEMIDAFKADGAHPFDVLEQDPREHPEWREGGGVFVFRGKE